MRTLLAVAIGMGSILALGSAADAARKYKRRAGPPDHHYVQPRYSREQIECERARHEDPSGQYAGFPCWAREAFGRGSNSGADRR